MRILKKIFLLFILFCLGLGGLSTAILLEGVSPANVARAAGTPGDACVAGPNQLGKWDAAGTTCNPDNSSQTKCVIQSVLGSYNSSRVCITPNAAGVFESNEVKNGIKSDGALTCDNLATGERPFISNEGFINQLCQENTIPGRSAIEVLIDRLSNYLVFLTVVVCMIMIILAIIQAGTAGPGGISAAKGRIIAAVSSIALLWVGKLYLDLTGITGGSFLGVNIRDGFTSATIPQLANAILQYLTYTGGVLCVVFIIVGGIRMMTSQGNPQGIAQAKKILTYAIGSLVAIVGVGLIFQLIRLVLTGSTT